MAPYLKTQAKAMGAVMEAPTSTPPLPPQVSGLLGTSKINPQLASRLLTLVITHEPAPMLRLFPGVLLLCYRDLASPGGRYSSYQLTWPQASPPGLSY